MTLRLFLPHESLREDISAYYLFDATNLRMRAIDFLGSPCRGFMRRSESIPHE
jgi:hypothetical protein